MIAAAGVAVAQEPPTATPVQWLAFAYLAAVSMYLGFFAWYRGLAIGPMAQVSQVQLTQPVMTIAWAALLLGEPVGWTTIGGGLAVIACAGLAVGSRLRPPRAPQNGPPPQPADRPSAAASVPGRSMPAPRVRRWTRSTM
jgi:drug/metabolite transporter (DMT)-like permease